MGRTDQDLRNIAELKAANIGLDFADADEAWESLNNAVGDDPRFEIADRAFAAATGGAYLEADGSLS